MSNSLTTIILIGPIGSGKSTIGKLIAEKLALPQFSMDQKRWEYYREIGYDEELVQQKQQAGDFWGVQNYWKPFEAHGVERLLSECNQGIIDFGAGHSVYEDDVLFQRVQQALKPYTNVFLLLPSPHVEESLQILKQRNEGMPEGIQEINEHFVRHPANYQLAKFTVYTQNKTPQETCQEIINKVDTK